MEKYYDSQDQDQLFSEARVVSPFRKSGTVKVKVRLAQQWNLISEQLSIVFL